MRKFNLLWMVLSLFDVYITQIHVVYKCRIATVINNN